MVVQVIITASKDKLDFCRQLGADEAIDRSENDGKWAEKVLSLTGGKGADIVIDFVGSAYFEQNLAALALGMLNVWLSSYLNFFHLL